MYSIEWQKRGLPPMHLLVWLQTKICSDQVNSIISAEIPDKEEDPILYEVVTKNMIHGSFCNKNCKVPCIVDGKCSKRFPRQMLQETHTGDDGYPLYRHRKPGDGGHVAPCRAPESGMLEDVDKSWVVPYSPLLCRIFKAHINVEYCNSFKSIKYIYKYVTKESVEAMFAVAKEMPNRLDETFSLRCQSKGLANPKTGVPLDDFPGYVTDNVLGRVYTVHSNNREAFHVRLLLHHVRGSIPFKDLKTVIVREEDGDILETKPCSTYTEACQFLGLLEDDSHWYHPMEEAAVSQSPAQLPAILLAGGRTAHSAFKLPLGLARSDSAPYNISMGTGQRQVLITCKLIVWDEATMTHRNAFHALDKTLQDLRGISEIMARATVVLAGDFRLHFPIDGKVPEDPSTGLIIMPCGQLVNSLHELQSKVYPNIQQNFKDQDWLPHRAILASRIDVVEKLNVNIQKHLQGKNVPTSP
ncbi:ATP-dependent DNA helicase [Trichonephila clavipes]|nr:ATP-dependent DNA helicase [Trichonephila clavipes]